MASILFSLVLCTIVSEIMADAILIVHPCVSYQGTNELLVSQEGSIHNFLKIYLSFFELRENENEEEGKEKKTSFYSFCIVIISFCFVYNYSLSHHRSRIAFSFCRKYILLHQLRD
ncbi:MAG: hypothetical protein QM536_00125 [Chitinophagaceae bacterium]|nr:hypothetical protein [Chitinophagaceae bacterium]